MKMSVKKAHRDIKRLKLKQNHDNRCAKCVTGYMFNQKSSISLIAKQEFKKN